MLTVVLSQSLLSVGPKALFPPEGVVVAPLGGSIVANSNKLDAKAFGSASDLWVVIRGLGLLPRLPRLAWLLDGCLPLVLSNRSFICRTEDLDSVGAISAMVKVASDSMSMSMLPPNGVVGALGCFLPLKKDLSKPFFFALVVVCAV